MCGLFVVAKKNGRLRLIADWRRLNQRLRKPTHVNLATASSIRDIELEEGEWMYYASHDIADCFFQFEIPVELSKYLCFKPLPAGVLGVTVVDGMPVHPTDFIYPCLGVLPMVLATLFGGRRKPICKYCTNMGLPSLKTLCLISKWPRPLKRSVA